MTRTLKLVSIVLAAAGLVFLGCESIANWYGGRGGTTWDEGDYPEGDTWTAPIIAGNMYNVGQLDIYFTPEDVVFEFTIYPEKENYWWFVQDVGMEIVTDSDQWDTIVANGRPNVGQMEYQFNADSGSRYLVYTIPWESGMYGATELWIVAHCCVQDESLKQVPEHETAFAGDSTLGQRPWWYFFYLQDMEPKVLTLPSPGGDPVGYRQTKTVASYPVEFYIDSPGGDHDLPDGYNRSFCLQKDVDMGEDTHYGYVYSGFDWDNLPDSAKYIRGTDTPVPYDKIAWIVNYVPPEAQEEDKSLTADVQHAIFTLIGYMDYENISERAQGIYDDASAYGDGYYPYSTDSEVSLWFPIVIIDSDPEEDYQMIFIQVDP